MRFDFCVIGGGIVGLATSLALLQRRSGASLILLEKESAVAAHQTGHNSGVIHAGVYYEPGSLKARLCREGNRDTYDFCRDSELTVERCGKLIVATDAAESARLSTLEARCFANQIEVQRIDGAALSALEPHIAGVAALLVPGTGIVDYRQVCAAIARQAQQHGALVRLGAEVTGIVEHGDAVEVCMADDSTIRAARLVVCAGLQSDRLARLAGLSTGLRIVPFRGEYFRLPASRAGIVRHLIYPVPDPDLPFLGVHLTRMIDGSITVGPNAVLGFARENYRHLAFSLRDTLDTLIYPGFWRVMRRHWRSALAELRGSLSRARYLEQCRKYCPELTLRDLEPHPAGIRAQAVMRDGTLVHDFMFADTARMVHVLNAPSPAATAALPIGRMIAARVLGEAGGALN
ncbi:MAG: L-2-hydroxyglutarate oxidase [Gammaproteobacteria bacterium]|nr:L-2-hydroxyglutarate oxidase [Gammaproteobacteria bacterium]